MKELITPYMNEIIVGLFALAGTVLGLAFPALTEYIRFRNKRNQEINKVISSSLEVWYVYFSSNIREWLSSLLDTIKSEPHNVSLSKEDEENIKQEWKSFFKPVTESIQKGRIEEIKNDYEEAIKILASYQPILAFRLRGMASLYEDLKQVDEFQQSIINELDSSTPNRFKTFVNEKINQNINLADTMKANILSLSLRFDVITYLSLKFYFSKKERQMLNQIRGDGIKLGRIINAAHSQQEPSNNTFSSDAKNAPAN